MKRTIFTIILLFAVLMCRTPPAEAAMDYSLSDYLLNKAYIGSGNYNDPLWQLWTELDASLISAAGADSILLTPGTAPTAAEGTIYYDDSSDTLMLYVGATGPWKTIDVAGASSLDTAYNNGRPITVDAGTITLTAPNANDNDVLTIVQSDVTGGTSALVITNAGTGASIEIDGSSTGDDITGTGDTWTVSEAGIGSFVGLISGAEDIVMENSDIFANSTNNTFTFDSDTSSVEDFSIGLGADDNVITFSSASGATTIDWGAMTTASGMTTITGDADDFTIGSTGTSAGHDVIIQQAGVTDQQLVLQSSGNAANALRLLASAAGIDVDAVGSTLTITNTADGAEDDITIEVDGDQNASIILTSDGTGSDAISLITSATGGDIAITSGDEINFISADIIDFVITGAATEDFIVTNTGGSIILTATEDIADGIYLHATTGGIDILADGAAAKDLDLTNTNGSVIITAGEANADAFKVASTGGINMDAGITYDAAINAGQILIESEQSVASAISLVTNTDTLETIVVTNTKGTDDAAITLTATVGGIDVDAKKSICLTSTENSADSVKIQSTLGGIDILADASDGEAIDIVNTGGPINIKSTEEGDASIHIETTTASGQLQITVDDTTTDALDIDVLGGIEIDAAEDIAILLTAGTNGEDLTIKTTGAVDNHIVVESAGTSADALTLQSSNAAGGIWIDAGTTGLDLDCVAGDISISNTGAKDIDIDATAGQVFITGSQSVADAVRIIADGTDGEISLSAKVGGIDIDAASGPIAIDAAGAAGDLITVTNTTGTGVSLTTAETSAIQLHTPAGGIGLSAGIAAKDAIRIESSGAAGAITIQNIAGTAASSTTQEDAAIQLYSQVGGIALTSGLGGADAIRLEAQTAGGLITVQNVAGVGASAATEFDAAIQLYSQVGGVGLLSGLNADDSIRIETNGGDDENITIRSNQGTGQDSIYLLSDEGGIDIVTSAHTGASAATESDAAIQLEALGGGIGLLSTLNADDSIRIETNGGDNENITIRSNQGTGQDSIYLLSDEGGIELATSALTNASAATEHDAAIQFHATGGGIGLLSTLNADDSIRIETNGGDDENITLRANQGTGTDSIYLLSDEGGVLLEATGLTDETAITLEATAGGIDLNAGAGKNITINGGQVLIEAEENAASALSFITNTGTSETIIMTNTLGNSATAINVTATAGGITIDAKDDLVITNNTNAAGDDLKIVVDGDDDASIILDSDGSGADAILLQATHATTGGITGTFKSGDLTLTGSGASADIVMDCDLFSIDGTGSSNISITANATGEDFTVKQDGSVDASLLLMSDGTSITDALIIDAVAGGIDIDSKESITIDIAGGTAGTADIILTNAVGTDEASIAINSTSGGIKSIFADDKDFNIEGGQFLFTANHVTGDTIKLHADAGASQTIVLLNDEGTGTAAINLTASAGGITLDASTGGITFSDDALTNVGALSCDEITADANSAISYQCKTETFTIGHTGDSTEDYQWTTGANHTAQNLQLGDIPAFCRIVDVTVVCTEAMVGQTAMTMIVGVSSADDSLIATTTCDALNEAIGSAAGGASFGAVSNAATEIWIQGDPDDNTWADMSAGIWDVMVTYIDVGQAIGN